MPRTTSTPLIKPLRHYDQTYGRTSCGGLGDGLRQTIKIFRFEFCFHAGDRLVEGPALRCPDALGAEMNCCLPLGAVEGVFVEGE